MYSVVLFLIVQSVLADEVSQVIGLDTQEISRTEENPIKHIIEDLGTPQWQSAVDKLLEMSDQPPSKKSSIASCALGDFYSGLIPIHVESWTPPPVNLKKSFQYYTKAILHPFPEISKAHYMISFIAYHHPSLVTDEFLPKYKQIHSRKDDEAPEGMDLITDDPSLQKSTDTLTTKEEQLPSIISPNIPLVLLHESFAARGNYSTALLSLAYKINNGHYTPMSCTKAAELYRVAAYQAVSGIKQNKPQIKLSTENVRLEEEYASGRSTITEEEDIIQFYRYHADTGNLESQIAIGIFYLEGDIGGLSRDYNRAFHYFQMGAEAGDPAAMGHLAYMYQMGYGTEADNQTAIELYRQAAQLGSSNAQTQLGVMYYNGWGIEKNLNEAKKWFEKAADKSEPEALLYLGRMAFAGLGMSKNYARARSFFQQSAQAGNLLATYNLGIINEYGFGVRPSCSSSVTLYKKVLERSILKTATTQAYKLYSRSLFDRALIHYEIAADQGDVLAQNNVAWLYEMGIGIHTLGGPNCTISKEESKKKALEFYIRASQQGSPEAHLKVGDYYYYGWVTPAAPDIAAAYYRVGSDLQNAQASFNLGYMHHYGIGLPKDPHLAKRYYDLSITHNPESYLPSFLALQVLSFEHYLNQVQESGLIFGCAWDTLVIVVLVISLLIALVVRQVVLLG